MSTFERIIVTDYDEVVVNMSPKWVERVLASDELRSSISDDIITSIEQQVNSNEGDFDNVVLQREKYFINDWLGVEPSKLMHSLYFDDEEFYQDLPLTRFGKGLQGLCESGTVDKLIILTHIHENTIVTESKNRHIQEHFGLYSEKMDVALLPFNLCKGKYLKDNKIGCSLFVDDHPKNVFAVLEHAPNTGFEVMFPILGYNQELQNEQLATKLKHTAGISIGGYTKVT